MLMRHLAEPLVGGNRVDIVQDGSATFRAMLAAIDGARDHVNIESYIVEEDGPGEVIAQHLLRRCREGLRVNLLFDSFGSLRTSARYFDRFRQAGVALCEYKPLRQWLHWPLGLHQRDHRKLMIVDGRVGFIGSVNISAVHGSSPGAAAGATLAGQPPWRDLHLRVEGPVVHRMQRLFVSHWQRHTHVPLPVARYFPPQGVVGTTRVALAATEAGRRRNPFHSALLGALSVAQSRVQLTTAYLVPPRRLLRQLEQAAARGVQVDMLLPGRSDFWMPLHAGRAHYARLMDAGVRIHERHDTLLHVKACVIDGVWSSVGSSNADWRSVLHNAEANLIVLDEAFARQMEAVFQGDLARARPVDPKAWARRPAWERCKEGLARRFEYFL